MTQTLVKLGHGLQLDIDKLIAQRMLITANSGGGKSYAVRVLAEATFDHVQHIIIDVDGEYHTLRERFDYMLFGKDGDYPADIRGAALLARRLLETKVSAIIDIYELGTQKAVFVQRFLEALVNAPRELWHPVLVFVDEAHIYAPETGSSVARGAVESLMTLGRKRGFCGVLATQRISKLSKTAAAECNTKLIGRSSLDIDMKRSADEIGLTSREEIRSLRKLEAGQFYAIGSAFVNTNETDLVQIGKAKTTHLSAGETRASKPAPPSTKIKKAFAQFADLPAEVDEELRTIDDFKTKIKSLTAQLAAKPKPLIAPVKTLEREIITGAQLKTIDKLIAKVDKTIDRAMGINSKALSSSEIVNASVTNLLEVANKLKNLKVPTKPIALAQPRLPDPRAVPVPGSRGVPSRPQAVKHDQALKGGPAKILECLIQHENGCTSQQIAVLTAYKQTSRYEYGRQLVAMGYATTDGDRMIATDAGRAAMPNIRPLPTGEDLLKLWQDRLTGGERKIFDLVVEAHPEVVSAEWIAQETGYKGTSIYEYGRQLVARELVTKNRAGFRASENLFA